MNKKNQYVEMSRRDKMLVENERIAIYYRPVRDGMWVKGTQSSLLFES
ncbi:MAG: hypothetical protein LBK97_00520 [Prevotellaceae bacterium]|jgi:hypothetical protein|nr:hypothetical protein [Prevotellaceae bacterium]